jgi:hypothetical protein
MVLVIDFCTYSYRSITAGKGRFSWQLFSGAAIFKPPILLKLLMINRHSREEVGPVSFEV